MCIKPACIRRHPVADQADNGFMRPATPTPPSSQLPTRTAGNHRMVHWLIGLPVAFFAALMLLGQLFNNPQSEERWVARETIRLCWKEVQKPPKAGKPLHFKAAAECEALEFDFKAQYRTNP